MKRAAVLIVATLFLGLVPQVAQAGGRGAFVVDCTYSHSLQADPIVAPGVSPYGHLHDFFGNRTVDANSTYESMEAATTTCDEWDDTAGYWSPAGFLNGVQISPLRQRIYYFGNAGGSVQTIPEGLKMIAGDHDAASPAANPNVSWNCGGSSPSSAHPYNCSPYAGGNATVDGVTGYVDFPQCWDGVNLDSSDHVSHMAYEGSGGCPADHPVLIPRLRLRVHFGIWDPCVGATPCGPSDPDTNVKLTLSSGPYYTLHADFWNIWKQPALDALVSECLNAHIACGEPTPYTPSSPGVSARSGDGVVHLTWTAPTSGSGITGYNVYRSILPGEETLIATTGNVSSYDDAPVTNGTTYYYTVAAVNSYGDGQRSGEISASPHPANVPDQPSLTASGGNTAVHLSWSSPPDGGSTITNYNVYRSTVSGQEVLLATLGKVTSFDDTGLSNGTTYYYRVSATNGVGEGPASTEASATPRAVTVPVAPTLTASRASALGVKLRWSAPADGGSPISGYRIYRGRTAGSEVFLAAAGNVTVYKDSATRSGSTYFYRVTAVNVLGEGPMSNEASAKAA
ncbi:MAG: DUF1996 domain-containing protein [Actinomycetota bacterium]|nr:DUF1996 domain-containing protein [Actinomycetota bacterium]